MAYNIFIKIGIYSVLFLFSGCPEDCNFYTKDDTLPDLVKIEQLQEVYNVGDVITYSVTIPSNIPNFGFEEEDIAIFEETGVTNTMLGGSEIHKFINNTIEVIEGENELIGEVTVANLIYYPSENQYRYQAKITFTQPGNYLLRGVNDLNIFFDSKKDSCVDYVINTNIEGVNENGDIAFTVE